ncbi:MAG: SixA phosphatase family protein [Agriterribacter sp.]
MRTIVVVRHAKSSWDDISVSDFDRTLNERGKQEAPMMAQLLFNRNIPIDSFISSPAKRARKTAAYFAKQFGFSADQIVLRDALYQAEADAFYKEIEQLDNALSNIALFSHNPGITDFVNSLSTAVKVDDMPTCSIFAVQVNITKWTDFRSTSKKFLFFDYPRLYR